MKAGRNSPRRKKLRSNRRTIFITFLLLAAYFFLVYDISVGGNVAIDVLGEAYEYLMHDVAFVVVFFVFIVFVMSIVERKKIKRSYCPYCGQHYDMDNIDWEVISEDCTGNSIEATVEFDCYCDECGESTTFEKRMTVAKRRDNGDIHVDKLDKLCRNLFTK